MLPLRFIAVVLLTLHASASGDVFAQQRNNRGGRRPQHAGGYAGPLTRKPNIVLILTDDQDVELGSLNFMPKTLRAIRDKGAEFRHAYVTTPMCCPSRSSLLTGMYVHNHNVFTNNDNCSSTQWQATHETRSFATYLSNAGYRTGYFGKYLNKYNGSYIPPGWREWGGLIMNSKYYNYSINMNGKKIKHGFDYHKDYYQDLIANDSIAFLRQSKKNNANKPVMLTMSFPAPHGPEDSAPQYSHLFFNVTTHHTPSYDYAPNPDKQWILQITNKMKPIHREFTDLLMTKRLQTLQSVDAAVQRVVDELEALGEIDNTYIVYTSDHGYHLGQFGLIKGKSFPFEFDVRVPFLVRGPGVEPGTVVDDIVLNIDLAPTFLDMADVDTPPHMDGRSVLPLFLNSKRKRFRWPDTFLIESSGRRETPESRAKAAHKYSAAANRMLMTTLAPVTTEESTPLSSSTTSSTTNAPTKDIYDSAEEHSDVENDDDDEDDEDGDDADDVDVHDDDDDLQNQEFNVDVHRVEVPQRELQLDNRLLPVPALPSKLERLAMECVQEEFKLPCKVGQKWFCQREHGRWRRHKCKQQLQYPQQRQFKKCACFTADGIYYKNIPINATQPKKQLRLSKNKRSVDFVDYLEDATDYDGDERTVFSHRQKRDTLAHVEDVMENIQSKLSGLQAVNASYPGDHTIKINLDTNKISETPGCQILTGGRINCSSMIYQDKKAWKRSRTQIDHEIQRLKQKLDNLKEIRRHLKNTKPSGDNSTGVVELPNNLDPTDVRSDSKLVNIPEEPTTERRRKKQDGDRKRFNATHSNHHRHQHQHHRSTTLAPTTTEDDSYLSNSTVESTVIEVSSTTEPTVSTSTAKLVEIDSTEDINKQEYCLCNDEDIAYKPDEKELAREERRRVKEERLKKKARKLKKKAQLEKECLSEKIHCFRHDNDHWRTAPLWTSGPFCFCMNANNNTYNCLRTINATHNLLYCEFVTGLATFYNLRIDPFELQNRVDQLRPEERQFLRDQLRELMACKGRGCTVGNYAHHQTPKLKPNLLPVHPPLPQPQRYNRRRKTDDFNAARTLPLSQASQHDDRNSRLIKLPKSWRRRKPWTWRQNVRERERRKQQQILNGFYNKKWQE